VVIAVVLGAIFLAGRPAGRQIYPESGHSVSKGPLVPRQSAGRYIVHSMGLARP
jgi:hypothetical protein